MEEREMKINISKREILDDSHLSAYSDINYKKNDSDFKENAFFYKNEISTINNAPNKLDVIEEETKNYIEDMKKGTYNIMVAVRCRPLSIKEAEFSNREIVKILDKKLVILLDPFEYNGHSEVFKNRSRESHYAFDYAFDSSCDQEVVFSNSTKFLLEGIVNGYNATVFAYGPTGAGKTYTMLGTEDSPGIMVLTLMELFNKIQSLSLERDYSVKLSYIEIYNENIKDLITGSDEYLDLREDPAKGISISGVKELTVTSCKDIMFQLRRGNKNRTQEATMANETSSRSHAILQVTVEYKDKDMGIEGEIKLGKLSLIDLAGSERASATQNRGIRLIEGANINRSLLTLGNCINALCEAHEKGIKTYVPYRDSKLTRLLKDSLGGNSRTVMIANISPAAHSFEDTYNTLKYANRAKNIKTNISRNVLSVQYHISNYTNIISNLKNEISELKAVIAKSGHSNSVNHYQVNSNKKEEKNVIFDKAIKELKTHCEEELNLKQKITDIEQEINNLNSSIKQTKSNFDILNSIETDFNKEELSERESKLNDLRQIWQNYSFKFKDLLKKREILFNQYSKLGIGDYQIEYLNSMIKANSMKIYMIENTYKDKYIKAMQKVKEDYITELELQVHLRDEILREQNVKIQNISIKPLDSMKYEYSNKLPIISTTNIRERSSQHSARHNNFSNNLPPISNLNNILSDINNIHSNINKLQKERFNKNQKKENNSKEKIIVRNFSQGLRQINNQNNSKLYVKNPSAKNLVGRDKSRPIFIKKINNNKEQNSEKSISVSNENSSSMEGEYSIENHKKRVNHFKEKKILNTESPLNVFNKPESLVRKKDLNVFLNDRTKFKSKKKMPFR